ncbi:hypothetical protein SAMN05216249_11662 [Acetitomaculum ruminis DSM 5522]|uniref:Uncharacterized protein n=1 Tax=Acetitomaculum ruminis DSM 5522 TaxID=1120918 RepID=A0A1I0ZT17_9FIRM|nr:hypothetical protein [Acetitomaculum ruminis]SFB27343.1 hypothetical protein SAMN05216249_11662 [Acetitomaculum ruminis DSM 5522]
MKKKFLATILLLTFALANCLISSAATMSTNSNNDNVDYEKLINNYENSSLDAEQLYTFLDCNNSALSQNKLVTQKLPDSNPSLISTYNFSDTI